VYFEFMMRNYLIK